jgi:hypothetical protein
METEIRSTEEAVAAETSASIVWPVALAQLPGAPLRARAACLQALLEGLVRLPITSRRQHLWHGVHAMPEPLMPDTEDLEVVEEAELPALSASA